MEQQIIFTGTGTSQGVPVIACDCAVCMSTDPKDKRWRTSAIIETQGKSIVIDTGPDFRSQMLKNSISNVDAILLTHQHKDHIAGLDDIRPFNFKWNKSIPVFAEDRVINILQNEFPYIFAEKKYPGIPKINVVSITNTDFYFQNIRITPIRGFHHTLPVLGFKIGNIAYITDMNTISDEELKKIQNIDILVINALRKEKHLSHFTLDEAIHIAQKTGAKRTFLTHISHLMGKHETIQKELPKNIFLAFDTLRIQTTA